MSHQPARPHTQTFQWAGYNMTGLRDVLPNMLPLPHDTDWLCAHISVCSCVLRGCISTALVQVLWLLICSLLYWHHRWTLTQLFLRGSFFHKGDSLQDSPEHHTQREDVSLGCVGQSTPHLWSHVEVRATGGGEVLPRQVSIQQTFTHLAQTKVCYLEIGQGRSLKRKYSLLCVDTDM